MKDKKESIQLKDPKVKDLIKALQKLDPELRVGGTPFKTTTKPYIKKGEEQTHSVYSIDIHKRKRLYDDDLSSILTDYITIQ